MGQRDRVQGGTRLGVALQRRNARETTALGARFRSACRDAAAGIASWRRRAGRYPRSRTAIIPRERGTTCSCRFPRGPFNKTGSCGLKLSVTGARSGVPSGRDTLTSLQVDGVLRGHLSARAKDSAGGFALDLGGELGQSVRRRAPLGKGGIAIDEPGQRFVDALERIRDLGQNAELNCTREETRTRR